MSDGGTEIQRLADQIRGRPRRRNLVVVRAGDNSLHGGWLEGEERQFDLLVSSYGNRERPASDRADYWIRQKGPKFPPLHDLFKAGIFSDYQYVWLPDDDLKTSARTIDGFFEMCRSFSLKIAQPALAPGSYWSHDVTLAVRDSRLRFTNFVEVMCPAFSREALALCASTFEHADTAWGLDYAWRKLIQADQRSMAVIDAHTVLHTRPVGLRYDKDKAFAELARNLAEYGVDQSIVVYKQVGVSLGERLFRGLAKGAGVVMRRDAGWRRVG